MDFLKLIFSKLFLKHLAIALIAGILGFWLILQAINIYARKGQSIEVPDFRGKTIDEISWMDNSDDFGIVVIDSMFDEDYPMGSVVLQDPPHGSKVKKGRKIYVTIVSTQPEMVRMPNLVDLSLRQALLKVESSGLAIGHLEYIENFAKNAVLNQKVDGEIVRPGTELLKGSTITLVLGRGIEDQKVTIPVLSGLTESEAVALLYQSALNPGIIRHLDSKDDFHSRVFRQQPPASSGTFAEPGSYVDLWFRSDLIYDFDSLINASQADTTLSDTLIINDELF